MSQVTINKLEDDVRESVSGPSIKGIFTAICNFQDLSSKLTETLRNGSNYVLCNWVI